MKYWFRPQKMLGGVACYYPSSVAGWVVTLVLVGFFFLMFRIVDSSAHSASDALLKFSPFGICAFLIFDWFCFKKGEYPTWWRR